MNLGQRISCSGLGPAGSRAAEIGLYARKMSRQCAALAKDGDGAKRRCRPFIHRRLLFMGSSMVSRFAAAMSENAAMEPNFGLEGCFVQAYGVSGRWAKDLKEDLWCVEAFKPEVVIIHAGGNDLSSFKANGRIEVVADYLINMAKLLHEQHGVKYVLISALLPRFWPYCWRDYPSNYEQKRVACNQILQAVLEETDYARLWTYTDITWPRGLFGDDGVHLTPVGNKIWYKHLRGCVIRALRGEATQPLRG